MRRAVSLFTTIAAAASCVVGCGAATPREADIYHDPALRPGVVAASGPEEQLLARLGDVEPEEEVVQVADQRFLVDRPYEAASGRSCRAVRSGAQGTRLACESDSGWVFVPQVLPTVPEPIPEVPPSEEVETVGESAPAPSEPAASEAAASEEGER